MDMHFCCKLIHFGDRYCDHMITGYEEVNKLYDKIICMYDAIVCNVCAHFPGFILLIEMLPLGNNYTYDYNIYIYIDTDIVLFECYHSHD